LSTPKAEAKLPEGKIPTLRLTPLPSDTSRTGDVHGGWVMARIDDAAGITARRFTRGRVATIAVNSMVFKSPVKVGDLVSFYTEIVHIGTTSVQINVEVYAERLPPAAFGTYRVTEATLTFVALDSDGRPRPIPAQ
jgi:acyl-CoA thioesterase YciA